MDTNNNMKRTFKRHDIVVVGGVNQVVISFKNGWVKCCPVAKCGSFSEKVDNTESFRPSVVSPF